MAHSFSSAPSEAYNASARADAAAPAAAVTRIMILNLTLTVAEWEDPGTGIGSARAPLQKITEYPSRFVTAGRGARARPGCDAGGLQRYYVTSRPGS